MMKAAFISYEVFLAKSQQLEVGLILFFLFCFKPFLFFFFLTKWMTRGKTIHLLQYDISPPPVTAT